MSQTLDFNFKTICSVMKVGLQQNVAVKSNSAGRVNIPLLWLQLASTDFVEQKMINATVKLDEVETLQFNCILICFHHLLYYNCV